MPSTLSRGGASVIADVQRWKYFLLRMGMAQSSSIDEDFGRKTEAGTKISQIQAGLPPTIAEATPSEAEGYTFCPATMTRNASA